MAAQTKSNYSKCIQLQGMVCCLPLYIIPKCFFVNVCGGCQETGAFVTSALKDVDKYQQFLSRIVLLFGVG